MNLLLYTYQPFTTSEEVNIYLTTYTQQCSTRKYAQYFHLQGIQLHVQKVLILGKTRRDEKLGVSGYSVEYAELIHAKPMFTGAIEAPRYSPTPQCKPIRSTTIMYSIPGVRRVAIAVNKPSGSAYSLQFSEGAETIGAVPTE